jgi:hypothetical protein
MVILLNGCGNHSNRLFQTLHLESFCLEKGILYKNLSFVDMATYYDGNSSIFLKIISKFFQVLEKLHIIRTYNFSNDDETQTYKTLMETKKIIFINGWRFRVPELTTKYQDYFIKRYSLNSEFYKNNESIKKIEKIKAQQAILVGVHIRRGDYDEWMDGKYYFDDDLYLKNMHSIGKQLEAQYSKNIVFVIFSNTTITIPPQDDRIIENNPWYIDQYLMSKCDYIIGPPSTFSMWASYIGKTKYFHITNETGEINLADFVYCHG